MENISTLIAKITEIIVNPLIILLFAIAGLIFFFGVVEFLFTGDAEKRSQGSRHMLWGVVGMTIMISVFGIMNFLIDTIDSFT